MDEIMFIVEQYLGNGIWIIVNSQIFRCKKYAEDLKNKLSDATKNQYRIKRLEVV